MTLKVKPPGMWLPAEDEELKALCRKHLPWDVIATKMNRLEKSVRIRAQVIKAS